MWREGSLNLVIFDHPLDDAKPHAAENRRLTGRTGSLPHRFGVRAEELAQLLNMARSRALGLEPANRGTRGRQRARRRLAAFNASQQDALAARGTAGRRPAGRNGSASSAVERTSTSAKPASRASDAISSGA